MCVQYVPYTHYSIRAHTVQVCQPLLGQLKNPPKYNFHHFYNTCGKDAFKNGIIVHVHVYGVSVLMFECVYFQSLLLLS